VFENQKDKMRTSVRITKTGRLPINVTFRRVGLNIVAVEKKNHYVF